MESLPATFADWRALVDKELAGKSFDKVLVDEPFPGVAVQPLYVAAPDVDPAARHQRDSPFRICMRHAADASIAAIVNDATNGADAIWLPLDTALSSVLDHDAVAATALVLEAQRIPSSDQLQRVARRGRSVAVSVDPIAWRAAGTASTSSLDEDLQSLGKLAATVRDTGFDGQIVTVSTLPFHDAGADAADEIAFALSAGARYVEALLNAGLSLDAAAQLIGVRISVGRDTFVEICKLRALRVCWAKMLAAFGPVADTQLMVHAVCSSATLTVRDPWVNMLRTTTQVFAAVIGGADVVTPTAFDEAFGAASDQARRIARNTGLVLREESALGRVNDPGGGSYAFESLTDQLAREAWTRFRQIEKDGGIVALITSRSLRGRLETSWTARLDKIAKRKAPIVGVSEFANLTEHLPRNPPTLEPAAASGLPSHRDATPFETLRLRAEAVSPSPEVVLLTLGSFAESRARVGFSTSLFAAGGLRTRETESNESATVVCLCGTDERYETDAVQRVQELKSLGAKRVLIAGRPRKIEAALRDAGVDGFIFMGCDAVDVLSEVLTTFVESAR